MSNDEVLAWKHLAEINCLPEIRDGDEVHLLIGLDQPDILAPREICRGNPGEPYAVLTGLGWTLSGPMSHGIPTVSSNLLHHNLQEAVERFWRLEEPSYLNHGGLSVTDKLVLSTWENKTYRDGSHYAVPIPFKRDPLNLPNNFTVAKHRLDLLGKRLKKDSDLHLKYSKGIQDNIMKGYAEEVSETDRTRDDGFVWYLPHHAVTNPRKPGKIRIVFDCAARYQGFSLNDHINQGPDLTNKLLGVLLRFRQEPVALSADIESMFCQVKVPPQHRDVLRFLWWDDDDPDKEPKFYRMTTHLFGGVWSPSAASFALQKVAEDYSEDFPPEVINTVKNDFYVDDCLKSVPTEDDAIALANGLGSLLARGGFKLTKWLSNSKKVMKSIPLEDWANSLHELNLDHDDLPYDRTLGVLWNVERDVFTVEVKVIDKPTTKRSILSITSSIYDPLGFVGPFILRAKIIFQQLCRLRIGWDDAVPKEIEAQWRRWLSDLPLLSNFSIPRCLKSTTQVKSATQIHHFCDASESAFGAVSYLTIGGESRLVMAKSRLAPIKSTTIPRLELMSAVVATELDQYVKRHLQIGIQQTFFWTDSMIVLHYINNTESRFQTFIANRITRIHERSEPGQWNHVDTLNNPADLVSRGMSAKEILNNNTWLSGPAFLKFGEERWPLQPVLGGIPDLAEIKVSKEVYQVNTGEQAVPNTTNCLFLRYSSWHRLKRAIVLLLRLKAILRKRINTPLGKPITVQELRSAEIAVIGYVQRSVYTSWNKKSSSLRRLKPFKDEDSVLRVGGRLVNAYIPYQARHPAIIPSDHHVTGLIINHYHLRYGHAGAERVLAEIRQRFWIVKGRSAVARALRSCITCRKWRAAPQEQQMAALPNSRVTPNLPPFTKVGVDYFGPFMVRRGRTELKRYGCVFTCLTTRAVHLEISFTLDTNSFINALQRFVARRGSPDEIRSDNGTNFVGAQKELRQTINEWNQQQISNHLLQSEIAWIFNPPGASHMGGVWERQIRTIRSVLNKLVVQQSLDDESLPTLFCCVEAIINGRPITKLSDDPSDLLPLTPNHLLLLRAGPTVPPGAFVHQDLYRRRWRQVQYLADLFWTRWLKEYLPALQETQKWTSRRRNMQPGDLVLLLNETTPRNQWPLGLITQVYPGPDGLVRVVDVKTQTRTYTRPVTKLCLLEANLVDV